MRILLLLDGMNGVSFHRLYTPYVKIQIDYGITVDVSVDQGEWADLPFEKYDCVVFNRWLGRLQYNILPILAKKKIPFIVDIDDYWIIPKHNPAYKFYRAFIKNGIKDSLHYADAVMVTTPQLEEKVKEFNENVTIIPNALDLNQSQWKSETEHPFTIGWVGGLSHTEDLKLLTNKIKPICDKYGARFLMCGFHENVADWATMEKAITGEPRHKRPEWFQTRVGTKANEFGKYYSEIDICIAPLLPTNFNRYKSELKILEAAAYKLPIFVSSVEPYTNHRDNLGCFFVKNNDWSEIGKLIKKNKVKEVGEINYHYCQEHHNLDTINKKRVDLLRQVCK